MKHLSKKGFVILFGSVLGVALIVWVVLIFGIFRKDKNEKKIPEWVTSGKAQTYELPDVPEGYELVFRLVAEYDVSESGKVVLRAKYLYDADGNSTESVYYYEDGKYAGGTKYVTNSDGSKTEITYDEKKAVKEETVWKYDSNGNTTEYITKRAVSDGRLVFSDRVTYEYDADGNKIRRTSYVLFDGKVYSDCTYDASGKPLMEQFGGTVTYYTYNENGDLLLKKQVNLWDPDDEVIVEENIYGEDGLLLEHRKNETIELKGYNNSGVPVWKRIYDSKGTLKELGDYNEKGLLIKTTQKSDEAEWVIVSDYDDNGNEIRCTRYKDGVLHSFVEREYDEVGAKFGLFTRSVSKDADGNVLSTIEMKYVEVGDGELLRVKMMIYDGDSTVVARGEETELDEYGNKVRYKQYQNGEVVSQTVYEYKAFAVPMK